jgi:predicted NBD/HSP70 family sugar kinase
MGLDIGEHKVRVAAADLRGGIAAETTEHFDPAMDGGARLDAIRAAIAAVRKDAQLRRNQILGACVGCTGGMDATTGDVLFTSAFPGLDSVNLRSELRRSLGAHVAVENDCNLAVVGERWHGVARDVEDVICVLASERLGAGIVVGGQLVRGHAGTAGEMPFLGAYADESGAEGVAQLVRTLGAEAMGADVDAEAVFAAARAGDPVAVDVIERSLEHAGRGIVIMALVLNPELVVIGGGIADAGDAVLDPLRRQLAQMVRLPPRLEASALGERGVLIGAIRRALDHVEDGLLDGLQEAA